MKEIPIEKRLEVACRYLLGCSYAEIEAQTGASHGTVANIVHELESGKLVIPGTPSDQVNDLRALALELKKEKLQPSQALLGLVLFQRLQALEVAPEHLEGWADLMKEFAQPDFSPKEFLEIALRLHDLEKSQGKIFETLAGEYMKLGEDVDKLKAEGESLGKSKAQLVNVVQSLQSQVKPLQKTLSDLADGVKREAAKLQELELKVKETEGVKSQLAKEVAALEGRRAKLLLEVDVREELLKKLDALGLSAEDLLRLAAFLGKTSKKEGVSGNQLKERFFSALVLFEDVSCLEKQRKTKAEQVSALAKKQSVLSGEILQLEKRKGVLEGELSDTVSAVSQKLADLGASAASQLQQQVADMKAQFNGLLAGALSAGAAIGEMKAMQTKGEESCRGLEDFMTEVKNRVKEH